MAVAVSSTGTAVYSAAASPRTFTFTVNSGDTLAVFFIVADAAPVITSVTWDSGGTNQACTLVGTKADTTTTSGTVWIYAVVNPTSGVSKTLSVVFTGTVGISAEMQSYIGTVTTSVAAACTNVLTANGLGTTAATAAQSGASGDMYVSAYVSATINSVNNTSIYLLAPAGNDAAANRLLSTGVSATLSAALTSALWAAVSCDIVASTAVVTPKWVPNTDPKHDVAIATHAKIAAVAIAAVYSFVPFNTPQINTKVDGWQQPLSVALPVAQAQLGSSFVPFNTTQITAGTPRGWQTIATPTPAIAFINAPSLPFIVPPFPVPSGWYQALATTPSSPPTQQGSALLSYNPTPITNTISGMGWFQALATTPPAPPSQIGASFVPLNTPQISIVISPYGWQQPLASTPTTPFVQLGSTSLSYNIQPLANTVVGMPWQQPLSTPPPVAVVYQGSSFVPYDTTQTIVITTLIQRTLTGVGL